MPTCSGATPPRAASPPAQLAREAIEAFVDVERAAVLDPADLEDEVDEVDEELEDDEWSGLERESSLDDAEES